jgi:hypothetical protein
LTAAQQYLYFEQKSKDQQKPDHIIASPQSKDSDSDSDPDPDPINIIMEPYVTASTISTSTSADMPIATATAVPVGEPYVATTAAASSSTKKKKKKKKKGTAAGGTGGDVELAGVSSSSSLQKPKSIKKKKTAATATTDGDVEFTDVSSSGKKPKSSSSKKPKSIRKKKKKKDSPSSMSTVYDNTPKSHPVLKASGWNQVTAREINSNAYASDDASNPTKHKYAITGKESQIVTVLLEPNETCQGEPGSMMYLSGGVSMVRFITVLLYRIITHDSLN